MCDSGSTESIPSLVPNSNTFDSSDTMKVKLRWVSITPLGFPVVPEVKMSEATASGFCRRSSARLCSRSTSSCGTAKASANDQTFVDKPASASAAASASPCLSARSSPASTPAAPDARATFTSSAIDDSCPTGTTVAPALRIPKYAIDHSGAFFANNNTRSPAATWCVSRKTPTRAASSARSA